MEVLIIKFLNLKMSLLTYELSKQKKLSSPVEAYSD